MVDDDEIASRRPTCSKASAARVRRGGARRARSERHGRRREAHAANSGARPGGHVGTDRVPPGAPRRRCATPSPAPATGFTKHRGGVESPSAPTPGIRSSESSASAFASTAWSPDSACSRRRRSVEEGSTTARRRTADRSPAKELSENARGGDRVETAVRREHARRRRNVDRPPQLGMHTPPSEDDHLDPTHPRSTPIAAAPPSRRPAALVGHEA